MPKLRDILLPSFRDFHQKTAHRPMIQVAYDSDLCQEVMANGWLSEAQTRHAAERYRLGKSKSGKKIYCMMDEMMQVRDGHLGDTWVSQLLKVREPELMQWFQVKHCLFGQHLLLCPAERAERAEIIKSQTDATFITSQREDLSAFSAISAGQNICVVESERSAVILSELFPESLWMAYVYPVNMTPHLFETLQGRSITIYPRTDPEMDIYVSFLEFAENVRRLYPSIRLTVDTLLEDNATADQKRRYIDLLDFIIE